MPETDTIPVSASVASVGKGIRYIGQHCYAYSGPIEASTASPTALEFTSGSGFILADVIYSGCFNFTDPDNGLRGICVVQFNGVEVAATLTDSDAGNLNTGGVPMRILIPPLTTVLITVDANDNSASLHSTVALTGRVYGAE